MATPTTKPDIAPSQGGGANVPNWPREGNSAGAFEDLRQKPTQLDALQALLAFSALHDQIRRRRSLTARHPCFDAKAPVAEFEPEEQFVLDEVLNLVAERAVAITGAD